MGRVSRVGYLRWIFVFETNLRWIINLTRILQVNMKQDWQYRNFNTKTDIVSIDFDSETDIININSNSKVDV